MSSTAQRIRVFSWISLGSRASGRKSNLALSHCAPSFIKSSSIFISRSALFVISLTCCACSCSLSFKTSSKVTVVNAIDVFANLASSSQCLGRIAGDLSVQNKSRVSSNNVMLFSILMINSDVLGVSMMFDLQSLLDSSPMTRNCSISIDSHNTPECTLTFESNLSKTA